MCNKSKQILQNMNEYKLNIDSSLNEILINIGNEISGLNAFPKSKEDFLNIGKKWLELNKQKLKERLCGNHQLQEILKSKEEDVEVASAIADIISSLAISIPPFTVSLLVLKYGLGKLCSE